jgi:hypothetical protein
VSHPRCPFCHDDVRSGQLQCACNVCRAWHHRACWGEAQDRCAGCGSGATGRDVPLAGRVVLARAHLPASARWLWGLTLLGAAGFHHGVLPAFAKMFREVGVSLPRVTELILAGGHLLLAGAVLTLLFRASTTRDPQAARWQESLAWVVALGSVLASVYALFAPLTELPQRL